MFLVAMKTSANTANKKSAVFVLRVYRLSFASSMIGSAMSCSKMITILWLDFGVIVIVRGSVGVEM